MMMIPNIYGNMPKHGNQTTKPDKIQENEQDSSVGCLVAHPTY